MGIHTVSIECQKKQRVVLEELEDVQQIKDDLVFHGKGRSMIGDSGHF